MLEDILKIFEINNVMKYIHIVLVTGVVREKTNKFWIEHTEIMKRFIWKFGLLIGCMNGIRSLCLFSRTELLVYKALRNESVKRWFGTVSIHLLMTASFTHFIWTKPLVFN